MDDNETSYGEEEISVPDRGTITRVDAPNRPPPAAKHISSGSETAVVFGEEELPIEPSTALSSSPPSTTITNSAKVSPFTSNELAVPINTDQTGDGPAEAKAHCSSSNPNAPMYPNEGAGEEQHRLSSQHKRGDTPSR